MIDVGRLYAFQKRFHNKYLNSFFNRKIPPISELKELLLSEIFGFRIQSSLSPVHLPKSEEWMSFLFFVPQDWRFF